jgi:hypothetical protein
MKRRLTNEAIVLHITSIRAKNNQLWMELLRLALKTSPKETKQILALINKHDKAISKWLGKLQH